MRLLQQQGVNGIDGFVTQVHLSALEVAHMKSNLNNSHALHQKDPKPPDNSKNEIGTPAMEIDEPVPDYSGIDQQKNEIHSGVKQRKIGEVLRVKPLTALAMIDEGELDRKIVAILLNDPKTSLVNDALLINRYINR
ncbi:hypothetical protein RIF29_07529 [Crotalaria pallida]|uniref:inorganic diphosphatase n=1 Tax=Crotalaria pallida TaxID=3830 RepID=A0AAN9J489_CROPI